MNTNAVLIADHGAGPGADAEPARAQERVEPRPDQGRVRGADRRPTPTSRCGRWCSPGPIPRSARAWISRRRSATGSSTSQEFRSQSCIAAVAKMRTPIIGAINGATFTGGLEMALGCDFLIASERAVFADTHARVGILPGGGMTARLPQLVGLGDGPAAVDDRRGGRRRPRRTDRAGDRGRRSRAAAGPRARAGRPDRRGARPNHAGAQGDLHDRAPRRSIDPALAAEEKIAFAQHRDFEGLGDQFRAVSERNKRQIGGG